MWFSEFIAELKNLFNVTVTELLLFQIFLKADEFTAHTSDWHLIKTLQEVS